MPIKILPNCHLRGGNTDCVVRNRVEIIPFSNIVHGLSLSQCELIAVSQEMNQGKGDLIQLRAACFVGCNTFYALENTIFVY